MNARHRPRPSRSALLAAALSGLLVPPASPAAAGDPWSTENLVSRGPASGTVRLGPGEPCAFQGAQRPLTLAEVVDMALCHNPQTREAWANARFQAAQVGIRRSAYLPSVDVTSSHTHSRTSGGIGSSRGTGGGKSNDKETSAGVVLRYLLYDFGARDAALENAREVLAAVNATQEQTLQSVFLAAVQAYYQVLAARAGVEAARETEKSDLEALNAAVARYNVGAATAADKLQAQTAHSQATLNRVLAEGEQKNAEGVLANSMGMDANQTPSIAAPPDQLPDDQFDRNINALIDDARRHRPDLAAAEAQIKAAQANVRAEKASGRPSISLSASHNYNDSSLSEAFQTSAIGVSVSIPLFTGYNTTYRTRAAEAQVDARLAQRDQLRLQVALEVWRAYQNLTTQTQALRSSADLLASATESERVALGRYKAGVGTILDLLTAQSALASARQQNNQAKYNWYIARVTLAQALGQLDFAAIEAAPAADHPSR